MYYGRDVRRTLPCSCRRSFEMTNTRIVDNNPFPPTKLQTSSSFSSLLSPRSVSQLPACGKLAKVTGKDRDPSKDAPYIRQFDL